VIDRRLSQADPTDISGFPQVNPETGRGHYAAMDTFPIEGDEIPDGYNGWLLFLDELTSANRAVQAASYQLIYDRQVGLHNLHPNVAIVAAGNLESDNAIVEPMSTALQSRLIHFEIELNQKTWLDWAVANGIDHRITSYVKFKPSVLYTFHPDHTDKTYASPRTWEFASRLIRDCERIDRSLMPLLAGALSEGVAREFVSFCAVYRDLPSLDEILAKPESVPVPGEPSVLYALTGAIASSVSEKVIEPVMRFVARLNMEWQVVLLRELVRRDRKLADASPVQQWIIRNSNELLD